jgi:hypothetical protein
MPIPVPAMIGLLQCERRLGQATLVYGGLKEEGGLAELGDGGWCLLGLAVGRIARGSYLKKGSQVHHKSIRPFVVGDLHHSRSSRRQTRGPG